MALYDNNKISSFYTVMAHEQHVCHYCVKAIAKSNKEGKVNRDTMHKQIRELKGKLTGQRVVRLTIAGTDYCICNDCLKAINNELEQELNYINSADTSMTENITTTSDTTVAENNSTEEKKTKTKGKK